MSVEPDGVAIEHLPEIVTLETDRPDRYRSHVLVGCRRRRPLVDPEQHLAGSDRVAVADPHLLDHPAGGSGDLVVHLHRLDEGEHLTVVHRRADFDEESDERALQLRHHGEAHRRIRMSVQLVPSGERWNVVIDCWPITNSAATAANSAGTMKPGCPVVSATNITAASGTR